MDPLPPDAAPEPANLRFLRRLVTVLTAVMIAGLLAVVALLVIRLGAPAPVTAPDALPLPPGAEARAVTRTASEWIVLTTDGRVLVFDAGGTLAREIALD